jgi:hypothetical protein
MNKRYHKRTQRNGNVEARKLPSDAITALPPTNVDLLVRKPVTFFCRVHKLKQRITYINTNIAHKTRRLEIRDWKNLGWQGVPAYFLNGDCEPQSRFSSGGEHTCNICLNRTDVALYT